jgi:pyruvate/2-oxoacid:ferredoxin oxidoreductase alpha subunit
MDGIEMMRGFLLDGNYYEAEENINENAIEVPLRVPSLDEKKTAAIAKIKNEAGNRILAKYPQTTQANMTARAVELLADGKNAGPEWTAIQAAWGWVKAMRAESKRVESAIIAAADEVALNAAVASASWPE